jgi:hypothetical protein
MRKTAKHISQDSRLSQLVQYVVCITVSVDAPISHHSLLCAIVTIESATSSPEGNAFVSKDVLYMKHSFVPNNNTVGQ